VGTIDAAGYLTIVDRLRDVIITGGENVFPAEVEAVLAQHPGVGDVAVIGIPDDRWGETVHAIVVACTDLSAAELMGFAHEQLAGFKCPTGVTIVEALPRNATGKVLRAALREPFWVGRDRRVS
jgi:acyl-CoA synthetase (AMP-forming)/AMP-acid ligase II